MRRVSSVGIRNGEEAEKTENEDERSRTKVQVCESRDILTIHLHDIGSCTCLRLVQRNPRDIPP